MCVGRWCEQRVEQQAFPYFEASTRYNSKRIEVM
jgi:hypothetical protein